MPSILLSRPALITAALVLVVLGAAKYQAEIKLLRLEVRVKQAELDAAHERGARLIVENDSLANEISRQNAAIETLEDDARRRSDLAASRLAAVETRQREVLAAIDGAPIGPEEMNRWFRNLLPSP